MKNGQKCMVEIFLTLERKRRMPYDTKFYYRVKLFDVHPFVYKHIEMQNNMFGDPLCTFLGRKLLLENWSENRLLLSLAKKMLFFPNFHATQ